MTATATRPDGGHETAAATDRATAQAPPAPATTRLHGAAVVLASCSVASGLIHMAMTPTHVDEWPAEGRAFAALAVAQLLVGAAAILRPRRLVWAAAAAVQVPAIVGWVWSRTAGFPFGPASGTAEPVGWIDVASTAFEAVAVVLALRLLLGSVHSAAGAPAADSSSRGGHVRPGVPAWAGVVGVIALAGTGALVASPAGQHDHGAAGTTHTHGAAPTLTRPLAPAVRVELSRELTVAREVAMRYPTVADALKGGLQQAGNFTPGSASHYVDISRGMAKDFVLEKPLAWLYSGTDPDSVIVGVMYYEATDTAPAGFAGPLDLWHQHTGACYRIEPNGKIFVPFSPDHDGTKAECEQYRGNYIDQTGYMVHAWVVPGWDSPAGVFSHDNPDILCADGRATVDDLAKGCLGT